MPQVFRIWSFSFCTADFNKKNFAMLGFVSEEPLVIERLRLLLLLNDNFSQLGTSLVRWVARTCWPTWVWVQSCIDLNVAALVDLLWMSFESFHRRSLKTRLSRDWPELCWKPGSCTTDPSKFLFFETDGKPSAISPFYSVLKQQSLIGLAKSLWRW